MDIGAWHCHGGVENGKYYYMDATVESRIGGIVVIPNCACTVSIPLYDYHCVECAEVFEAIKPVALRDGPVACPICNSASHMFLVMTGFASIATNRHPEPLGAGVGCGAACRRAAMCCTCAAGRIALTALNRWVPNGRNLYQTIS